MNQEEIKARLEELRTELRAERISYGELAELAELVDSIEEDDVELLEAAGVPEHATIIRYVITHINKDGTRQLTSPQQGRYTHAAIGDAEMAKDSLLANNSEKLLAEVYGRQAIGTFEVRPCKCHAGHFDPKGIYFDVNAEEMFCHECGKPYSIDAAGVSRHIGSDGGTDHDADEDHAAYG
jgi:hypothetical protein